MITLATDELLLLLLALQIKHFTAEFVYQPAFMWQTKGNYGSLGGLAHSGLHAVLSFAILFATAPILWVFALVVFEFAAHYHTDWCERTIQRRMNITIENNPQGFWLLTGADQAIHQITYLAMVWVIITLSL